MVTTIKHKLIKNETHTQASNKNGDMEKNIESQQYWVNYFPKNIT